MAELAPSRRRTSGPPGAARRRRRINGRGPRLPHQGPLLRHLQGGSRYAIPIKRKSITAFIGPSGCGKSTVLRCLNRMNDLVRGFRFDGHVRFRGRDIYDAAIDPVAVRRFIGMVFQQPNPFATSIYNNVAFGLRLNGFKGDTTEKVEKRCAARRSGTKSRTSSRRAACRCRAASSSGCASPARSPPSRKCC